ncbi:MAG: transporter [Verrucomicrobiota bacterium]
MKTLTRLFLTTAACSAASSAFAFGPASLPVGSHYPVGAEGIKGASLPPPGVYLRDYNFFYNATTVPGLPVSANIFAYVQAPRLIWMTPLEVLGANYGMDVIVPFAEKDIRVGGLRGENFNLADIQIEPLLLSWHLKQFDLAAGYAIWAPSGNFDFSAANPVKALASPGNGYWSHMLTLGGVWYPDEKKTWSMSVLGRYEICQEQEQSHVTPGNAFTIEWGLSKSVAQNVDVGLVGYYQQQVTKDSGGIAPSHDLSRIVGVGPEISAFCSKLGVFTSLRYVYETDAIARPQGQTVTLTFTKRF